MVDNTTMYLTWEPPPAQHLNGPLQGYKVIYNYSFLLVSVLLVFCAAVLTLLFALVG